MKRKLEILSGQKLSERERQTVASLARNMGPKQIGAALGVAKQTVDSYRVRACHKIGVWGVAALTHYAIQNGLVELGDLA